MVLLFYDDVKILMVNKVSICMECLGEVVFLNCISMIFVEVLNVFGFLLRLDFIDVDRFLFVVFIY